MELVIIIIIFIIIIIIIIIILIIKVLFQLLTTFRCLNSVSARAVCECRNVSVGEINSIKWAGMGSMLATVCPMRECLCLNV